MSDWTLGAAAYPREALAGEEDGGSGTQKFVYQTWPNQGSLCILRFFPLWSLWSGGRSGGGGYPPPPSVYGHSITSLALPLQGVGDVSETSERRCSLMEQDDLGEPKLQQAQSTNR